MNKVLSPSRIVARFAVPALIALLWASAPATTWAWGPAGHSLVAQIADARLTTQTREQVRQILGEKSMAEVASWADEERTRDRSTYSWHFIDWEISDGSLLIDPRDTGTILDAISSQSAVLRDPSADPGLRRRALMFVIHFIGDMHQPLHCADNHDKGGNDVRVEFNGHPEKLHKVWDSALLDEIIGEEMEGTTISLRAFAAKLAERHADQADAVTAGTPETWARDSHEIAKKVVYNFPHGDHPTSTTVTLPPDYLPTAKPVLQTQLAKGGFRLARLLNDLLDPKSASAE